MIYTRMGQQGIEADIGFSNPIVTVPLMAIGTALGHNITAPYFSPLLYPRTQKGKEEIRLLDRNHAASLGAKVGQVLAAVGILGQTFLYTRHPEFLGIPLTTNLISAGLRPIFDRYNLR